VTCAGERVDLQPFDDAAMKQLQQRFPVRLCTLDALRCRLSAPSLAPRSLQGLVVVDYTHPSTVHANAQARSAAALHLRWLPR